MKIVKYIIVSFLLLTISCSCSKENKYYYFLDEAKKCNVSNEEPPFNTELILERLTDDYLIYRFYIDQPTKEVNNIEAIIVHDYKTDDIFPSSGLYEDKLNMSPGVINEDKKIVKGIALIGYIKNDKDIDELDISFKALIKYNNEKYCFNKKY